ncbi:MAG: HipA N-terminal domain-containing protein [Verrucomicrobiota bacterium]
MRKGEVRVNGIPAGVLEETADGFRFLYYRDYAGHLDLPAVSLTLPKRADQPHESPVLFPFFAGLLTEGTAMHIQCRMLKLDETDLFGRLLKTARDDVVGNVTVHEMEEKAP